ncbi:hypothetical protein EHM76_00390 [bacterium]|nr:MAG: hypothetical protein EHM76_00390 [bacterium]
MRDNDMDTYAPYGAGPLGEVVALDLNRTQLARAQFLTWLKSVNHDLFKAALKHAETEKANFAAQTGNPAALSGLGENGEPKTWWQSLAEGLTTAGTAYLAYKGQKANIDLNLQRAQQGLPPIDYSRYTAPTVRTQVDVSPEILARLREGGTNTLLLIGGVAAAFLLLPRLLGRGRR